MSCKRLLATALPFVLLAGCESVSPVTGSPDPGMGEAVKYNAAIQTINPDPIYGPDDAQPGDSGAKGAAAIKRYRTDAVKDVETIQTSSGSGPQ